MVMAFFMCAFAWLHVYLFLKYGSSVLTLFNNCFRVLEPPSLLPWFNSAVFLDILFMLAIKSLGWMGDHWWKILVTASPLTLGSSDKGVGGLCRS